MHTLLAALLLLPPLCAAQPPDFPYQAGCNSHGCSTVPHLLPKWKPTYQMNLSTILMTCNYTGPTDPTTFSGWAYVDFDWSNWKGSGKADGWAKHKPMDCEELMVKQVDMTVAHSPGTRSFVYRNSIMALPWFTSVRKKLANPLYAPWFMNFSAAVRANHSLAHVPVCDTNYHPPLCSNLYHDQVQTPGFPHGDGDCAPPGCDCGGVPCGEYLFDFRNANVSIGGQTFIEWYIEEYMFGESGMGNEHIVGLYLDDDWGNMNPDGPSEMEGHVMADMGLGPADLKPIVEAYNWAANLLYHTLVARGKWAWDLFLSNDPNCINCGDCPAPWVKKDTCAADLRYWGCNASSPFQSRALLYGFGPGSCAGTNPGKLASPRQDVANFLLVRGDFAVMGNGWLGCSNSYQYPSELFDADYGEPLGLCRETAPGSEVFVREWSKATVQMDCRTWTPSFHMHEEHEGVVEVVL